VERGALQEVTSQLDKKQKQIEKIEDKLLSMAWNVSVKFHNEGEREDKYNEVAEMIMEQ
jgi:hypothetical protein